MFVDRTQATASIALILSPRLADIFAGGCLMLGLWHNNNNNNE